VARKRVSRNTIYVIPVSKDEGGGLIGASQYGLPILQEGVDRYVSIEKFRLPIQKLISFATTESRKQFIVTRLGCTALNHDDYDIAPFFDNAPPNMILPSGWRTHFLDIANRPRNVQSD
jgi:hypothetical protein